jgi:hypothetical protein
MFPLWGGVPLYGVPLQVTAWYALYDVVRSCVVQCGPVWCDIPLVVPSLRKLKS